MFVSLKARLVALALMLTVAAIATGALLVGLFRQSSTARVGQATAQLERACDAVSDSYRFYSAGMQTTDASVDAAFRKGLTTVVQSALTRRPGIEGGVWQQAEGSLAYAFPTYEGSGPKTDLPQAELTRIEGVNGIVAREDRPSSRTFSAASQTLILAACPLSGPLPQATAWTMTRVMTFAGQAYTQLMAGLAVLLTTVLAATVFLTRLLVSWSRHTDRIRASLEGYDLADLPTIPLTGERELDRVVVALNDARARLAEARERAREWASKVANTDRLAAIGRVTAGVAHEIRNPIAAMRLKAENALAKGGDRYPDALAVILDQIGRLERLVQRLLNVTEPARARLQSVNLESLLRSSLEAQAGVAEARSIQISCAASVDSARLDPHLLRLALDNLLVNAIQAAPAGSSVEVRAEVSGNNLIVSVRDVGTGPPPEIEHRLFEPFVSGRPDGTGLGLPIVREVAEAHGGTAGYHRDDSTTRFELILPWQPS